MRASATGKLWRSAGRNGEGGEMRDVSALGEWLVQPFGEADVCRRRGVRFRPQGEEKRLHAGVHEDKKKGLGP